MTEPIKPKNAYESLKAFRKIAADELEFRAVAHDYIDDVKKVYEQALTDNNNTLAEEVKKLLEEITQPDLEIIRKNV